MDDNINHDDNEMNDRNPPAMLNEPANEDDDEEEDDEVPPAAEEGDNNMNFEIPVDNNGEEEDEDGGSLDGGVAHNPDDPPKDSTAECDLILYFACDESFANEIEHPIMRPGVRVAIGLDKTTKLLHVFDRYVEFCNEQAARSYKLHLRETKHGSNGKRLLPPPPIVPLEELEFVHCQVLYGSDTAETSALMKKDKVHVRRVQTSQLETAAELVRIRRDADRAYFHQLRQLTGPGALIGRSQSLKSDVIILDCQGKVMDEDGRHSQPVFSTEVKAYPAVVSQRCAWLGELIKKAKLKAHADALLHEMKQATPDEEDVAPTNHRVDSDVSQIETADEYDDDDEDDEEEDDGIEALDFSPRKNKPEDTGCANAIENDDDDDDEIIIPAEASRQEHSPIGVRIQPGPAPQSGRHNYLRVPIPHHSPEAVKILLEYCYTNRVLCLGQEAFSAACKTKPHKHKGPVPPCTSRRWPHGGVPTVPFSVALAGVALAEEAGMPRLALMCEVAAAETIDSFDVVEALKACTIQKEKTGNDLSRLRKASMDLMLRSGPGFTNKILVSSTLWKALRVENTACLVPTLFQGTMEAVTSHKQKSKKKRDHSATLPSFDDIDRDDAHKREGERLKRRWERCGCEHDHLLSEEILFDEEQPNRGWFEQVNRYALKRMSRHLVTGGHERSPVSFQMQESGVRGSGRSRRSRVVGGNVK